MNCIARWKIGNIGNIVVHQQLSRQQIGNRPATSATLLSINNLIGSRLIQNLQDEQDVGRASDPHQKVTHRSQPSSFLHPVDPVHPVRVQIFNCVAKKQLRMPGVGNDVE
jgi:hypothetical protein